MNAKRFPWNRILRRLRNLAIGLAAVGLFGTAVAVQAQAVNVAQQPLVIQVPLAPNLVLMLDDSGSMGDDYMPDWGSLGNTTTDGMRYYGNNYMYYNPNVLYTPPPHANGTLYPDSPGLDEAYKDGFLDTSTLDVTDFTSTPKYAPSGTKIPYFESFTYTVPSTYPAVLGCNDGDSLDPSNPTQCRHVTSTTDNYYTIQSNGGSCNAGDQYVLVNNSYRCDHLTYTYSYYTPVPTCPLGGTPDATGTTCTGVSSTKTVHLFTYTSPDGSGGYVRHFVGKSSTDCNGAAQASNYPLGASCDSSARTRQSVANWFSYYRTRIEMAKSGVMSAFVTLPPQFRVGFGSINGTNNGAFSTLGLSTVSPGTTGKTIATVRPFDAVVDTTTGTTQKEAFWSWLAGIVPSGNTPLRTALDAVGQYYQTTQPWETDTTITDASASGSEELACRQSYTILTTDGLWNSTDPGVGEVDNVDGTKITGPNGLAYTYKAAPPYAGSTPDTLADVAMKYWETDLRSGIKNEVTPSTEDPAFWQHMTTFALSIGVSPTGIQPAGTTVKQIFDWSNGGSAISNFSWPTPSSNSPNNIADLAHAAVNGHGGFYAASSPQAFTAGMQSTLDRAAQRVGTGASLAANSTELKTGTVAYQANYYTVKWKGDLKALAVDPNTGAISSTPTWQAAKLIPTYTARKIYTYNYTPGSGTTGTYESLAVSGGKAPLNNLSTAQQSALGINATVQQEVLNYLLGDQSKELDKVNGIFRTRDTVLGDIVDSQPVYVGSPEPNQYYGETFTGSVDYPTFATNNQNREALIWVAANDGMLHAFDATTGTEKYAYLPGAVIPSGPDGLKALSDPAYGTSASPHQYFNDGELTVADVYLGGAWKTVLVGTTGRGPAEAIYALDITDPSSIQFLWERSAGDGLTNSNYIGQMVGKPVIAQTSDGTWSVLIGNGYNSANGVAALLQFDLSNGGLSVHTTSDTSTSNGMAAPAVWIDNPTNGISTMAYAGDLDGNVWSFALQSGSGNNSKPSPSSSGTLLFTTPVDATSGLHQPITGGMLVGQDPNTSNLWLFFGTGRYLSASDITDTSVQSWYGIIVRSSDTSLKSLSAGLASLKHRYIVAQTPGDPTANPPVLPARAITPMPTPSDMTDPTDNTDYAGWYINLQTPVISGGTTSYLSVGERMVTPNQFQGNVLLGTTRIPQAKDLCNPSGSGWIMAVDPWTGTNPVQNFFDVNGNGQINSGDSITVGGKTYAAAGVGFNSLPNNPIFVGGSMLVSFDNGTTGSLQTSGSTGGVGRVSWREITTQ